MPNSKVSELAVLVCPLCGYRYETSPHCTRAWCLGCFEAYMVPEKETTKWEGHRITATTEGGETHTATVTSNSRHTAKG